MERCPTPGAPKFDIQRLGNLVHVANPAHGVRAGALSTLDVERYVPVRCPQIVGAHLALVDDLRNAERFLGGPGELEMLDVRVFEPRLVVVLVEFVGRELGSRGPTDTL